MIKLILILLIFVTFSCGRKGDLYITNQSEESKNMHKNLQKMHMDDAKKF